MKRNLISQRYSQKGVSLVELMVGLTVGLIITAGAFTALFSNQKLILDKEKIDRSQENFRFASTIITRMIRQATSFGFPENNNELIVYFDSSQRDCLGESNHSSVNKFKLNDNNELLCEFVLNDGEIETVTLAKNIHEVKFAYGIQNGTGTSLLAYETYLDSDGTVNSTVDNVWGTITSVLTKMSIEDGSGKKPTIDFIATSHLRAMTQLASTGGTSLVNQQGNTSSNPSTGSGQEQGQNDGKGDGEGQGQGDGQGQEQGRNQNETDCSVDNLSYIKVDGRTWENSTTPTLTLKDLGNKATFIVEADLSKISKSWTVKVDNDNTVKLQGSKSYTLAAGNTTMTFVFKCGTVLTRTVIVKAK